MALLFGFNQAFDANGDPAVGASLTIYTAGTTTPVAIFSDAALSSSLTNPLSGGDVADAAGRFPQIFAAEGTVADIILKDSGGGTLDTWEDVSFLGSDSGDLTRTLADDTRFKVSGSGGVVYVEAGDPSPDNTGGTLTLRGWSGTQGDLLTLNFAVVNVSGRLKENSKKIPSVVYTEPTTFTAVSSVDIALPEDPADIRMWDIDVIDFSQTAATAILVRLSYDGGSTFKSGGSDYLFNVVYATTSSTGADSSGRISVNNTTTPSNQEGYIHMRVITPESGNSATNIIAEMLHYDTTATKPLYIRAVTQGVGNFGRATHVRLLVLSGSITGKYRVTTIRGSGET